MDGDEFVLDTPVVRAFVADVREAIAAAPSPAAACDAIRPRFAALLADDDWLPARYRESAPESGMGGGIGQWLLFRAGDRSLSLFALVVPPEAQTPVHDHLAWGLVGLYRGTQDEEIYAEDGGGVALRERRALRTGDFYALLPPRNDIHRVRTTSPETSVSIHLLTKVKGSVRIGSDSAWLCGFRAAATMRSPVPSSCQGRARAGIGSSSSTPRQIRWSALSRIVRWASPPSTAANLWSSPMTSISQCSRRPRTITFSSSMPSARSTRPAT
jgi:3-mercaptopropionate dioxygenase